MKTRILLTLASCLVATSVSAQTIKTICNAGCDFTNGTNGANLPTAVAGTPSGGTLLLQHGFTYQVNLQLRNHGGSTDITIQTGVSPTGVQTSLSTFPAAGVRMTAALAASLNLAKIQSPTTNAAAITTAAPSGGTAPSHWTIRWVEGLYNGGTELGSGTIFQCGSDSNSVQTVVAEIPSFITFDQVYMHGHSVKGQYRGLSMHCNDSALINSSILDIKSTQEGQAIFLNSYSQNVTIRNNDIQGGAEVIIQGGSSGCCRTGSAVVAGANSATQIIVADHTDLHVGQNISVETNGTVEEETAVASCGTSVVGALCTSNTIGLVNALSATPVVTADVDWGLVPAGLVLTKNHIWRPAAWRNPFLGTPQAVTLSTVTGGTLAAGTYAYRVVAYVDVAGQSARVTARSSPSNEVQITTASTGSVKISWAAVTGAEFYRVFGRSAGGEATYWTTTTATTYTDTGVAGTALAVPTTTGTTWYVKNLVEMKNGSNILIEGNVVENVWKDAQSGYTLTLTPANTGNGNDSTRLQDVTIRNNIFRNGAGGIEMTARDVSTNDQPSGRTERITISNNLWYGLDASWGASIRDFILSSRSTWAAYPSAGNHNLGPDSIVLNHNTFSHTSGNAFMWFDLFKGSTTYTCSNCTWSNNIASKLTYGLTGGNSCTQGNGCWTTYTSGTTVWQNNVVSDAVGSSYPGGATETLTPSFSALTADFTDPANGNFALKSSSAYKNAGTDGADIGANIAAITPFTNIAMSGTDTGGTVIVPPSITTATIPGGQINTPYSVTLTGVCPTTPCTWALSGTLPTGIALTQVSSTVATISGTPGGTGGTFTPTVTLTDSGSRSGSQTYIVTFANTVVDVPPDTPPNVANRADRYNLDEGVHFRRAADPCVEQDAETPEEPCRVGDIWADTSTTPPTLKLLTSLSPTPVWSSTGGGTSGVPLTNMTFSTSTGYSVWGTGSVTLSTTPLEFLNAGRTRVPMDLTGYSQCRVWVRVGTATGGGVVSNAWAQYSTDLATTGTATWADLGTTASTPAVNLDSSITTMNVGAWKTIAAGAKTEVVLRIVAATTSGTSTVGTPAVGNLGMTCK